ncbi:hypothetical protein [Hyphomicrobium nitrativorans]|uniref:hypothetical protein n=1 Tax=Hyphomicrobium nitrativorans TaxID=1427356 RepID=UPI000A4AB707|nr:hypothetical protein [Hyphomicrobium nitrativorans]
MTRAIVTLCLAAVLTIAGPAGMGSLNWLAEPSAFADTKAKAKSRTRAKAGQKTCTAKTNAGDTKTWQCPANQACCINRFMDQYVCGIPGLGCL